ncbi:MAG: Gfo/Idh/MocA family oxidoreductase, partial [Actinopolymorphaceae bacterium]
MRQPSSSGAIAHGIPPEHVFSSWRDLVAAGKLADAAIVATQDAEHVEPAVALANLGCHLLVEKPAFGDPDAVVVARFGHSHDARPVGMGGDPVGIDGAAVARPEDG